MPCPAPSDKLTCGGDPSTDVCQEQCTGAFSGDGGPALEMRMNQPFKQFAYPQGRLVYDKAGNLYFADSGNNRVRIIDTQGIVHTVAGNGTGGYTGDGGPATQAELDQPIDLAMADDGTLYIADHLEQLHSQGRPGRHDLDRGRQVPHDARARTRWATASAATAARRPRRA